MNKGGRNEVSASENRGVSFYASQYSVYVFTVFLSLDERSNELIICITCKNG